MDFVFLLKNKCLAINGPPSSTLCIAGQSIYERIRTIALSHYTLTHGIARIMRLIISRDAMRTFSLSLTPIKSISVNNSIKNVIHTRNTLLFFLSPLFGYSISLYEQFIRGIHMQSHEYTHQHIFAIE